MVLHPEVAAEESYAKRNLDKKKNERSQYSHVTLPSQLTDKKARAAIRRQEEQFALSARSYTAAEGANTDNWAEVNCLLLKVERGVTEIPRYSGLSKTRNIVPVNTTPNTNLSAIVGHGGMGALHSMFDALLDTGEFDNNIARYQQRRASNKSTTSMELVSSNEVLDMHKKKKDARKSADQNQSTAEVASNPNSGVLYEEVDLSVPFDPAAH